MYYICNDQSVFVIFIKFSYLKLYCLCREMRAKFTERKLMLTAAVSAGFQTVNQVNRIPAFDSHRTGFPLHHINKEPKKVEKTTLFFPDMILIQK